MKTSIALCTYNGEKYLKEQLDSILNQTVKPNEIIICDDGSKDSTIKILNDFESKYSTIIRVFQNKKNIGFVKNFEKAVSLCSEEIILLSDQDDIWKSNKIEIYIKFFEQNANIFYAFSDARAINEKGNKLNYAFWESAEFTKKKQKIFEEGFQMGLLIKSSFVQGASLAIRNEAKKYILPFSENFSHDHWIALILSNTFKNAGILIHEPYTLYRIHNEQTVGLNRKNFIIKQIIYIRNLFQDHTSEFNDRIAKFNELKSRLIFFGFVQQENIDYISDLIYFLKTRNQMYGKSKIKRFKLILQLLKKDYYKKFSHSNLVSFKEMFEKLILHGKRRGDEQLRE